MFIKISLYIVLGIALIALMLFVLNRLYSYEIIESDYSFKGEIEQIAFASVIDGADKITVSGKEILVFPSMALVNKEPVGKMLDADGSILTANYISMTKDKFIGKKVEVFCRKIIFTRDNKERLELIGKDSYYIKILPN